MYLKIYFIFAYFFFIYILFIFKRFLVQIFVCVCFHLPPNPQGTENVEFQAGANVYLLYFKFVCKSVIEVA